ncbi:hypothetical protein L2E82_18990 [Cichorium intybus]|uniref:Uncharacterized protein n=1 Tax=Cichorium intybus TaxID=13427 RepID=A0ACB9FCF3_CICIN|nr:hypothetical protein L2E82_18990 [Cichorium intybus]
MEADDIMEAVKLEAVDLIWVCESEYGEDEGNCEFAFLIFPINEHNRVHPVSVFYKENQNNLLSDAWRIDQLKKHISAEGKVNNVVKDKNEVYQGKIVYYATGAKQ